MLQFTFRSCIYTLYPEYLGHVFLVWQVLSLLLLLFILENTYFYLFSPKKGTIIGCDFPSPIPKTQFDIDSWNSAFASSSNLINHFSKKQGNGHVYLPIHFQECNFWKCKIKIVIFENFSKCRVGMIPNSNGL